MRFLRLIRMPEFEEFCLWVGILWAVGTMLLLRHPELFIRTLGGI